MKRLASFLLTLVMLLSLATPASAAAVKTSGAATTLRLESVTGTVQMKNGGGKSVKAASNARLYNGYKLSTKKASYAHVSLDDAKVIQLDASSGAEVFQSGKKLELKVNSGQMFFNVSEPLKGSESLTIRTSTMVTGVRGTSGWVKVIDRNTTRISLLEGKLTITSVDPLTGKQRVTVLVAGQTATIVYQGAAKKADGTLAENDTIRDLIEDDVIHDEHIILNGNGLTVENLQEEDVPGFVAKEVKDDKELQKKIEENSPLSVPEIIGDADARLESAEKAAEEEEKTILEKLKDLVADTVEPLFKDDAAAGGGGTPVVTHNLVILRVNEDGIPITTDGYQNQVTSQSTTAVVEGAQYSAGEPMNIPGYVYVGLTNDSDPAEGIMDTDKTVIHQYRITMTQYDVTMSCRTEGGIDLTDTVSIQYFEGEEYSLNAPEIEGYTCIGVSNTSDAATGVVDGNKNIIFIYTTAPVYTISVRHVTQDGTLLLQEEEQSGVEGTDYESLKNTDIEAEGYIYVGLSNDSDPATGYLDSDKDIIHVYRLAGTYSVGIGYEFYDASGTQVMDSYAMATEAVLEGTTRSLTCAEESRYVLDSVLINGEPAEVIDNTFAYTVDGNTNIVIKYISLDTVYLTNPTVSQVNNYLGDGNAITTAYIAGAVSADTSNTVNLASGKEICFTNGSSIAADVTLATEAGSIVSVEDEGTFTNNGTINGAGTMTVMDTAEVVNNGEITIESTNSLHVQGVLTNYATVNVGVGNNRGLLAIEGSGILTNYGTLNVTGSGTLTVAAGATLNNAVEERDTAMLTGSISNNGTITNSGTFTNAGVLTNAATLTNETGSTFTNEAGGVFENTSQYFDPVSANLVNRGAYQDSTRAYITLNASSKVIGSGTTCEGMLDSAQANTTLMLTKDYVEPETVEVSGVGDLSAENVVLDLNGFNLTLGTAIYIGATEYDEVTDETNYLAGGLTIKDTRSNGRITGSASAAITVNYGTLTLNGVTVEQNDDGWAVASAIRIDPWNVSGNQENPVYANCHVVITGGSVTGSKFGIFKTVHDFSVNEDPYITINSTPYNYSTDLAPTTTHWNEDPKAVKQELVTGGTATVVYGYEPN